MPHATTDVLGIEIPSASPLFLAIVGLHVLLGLSCVVTGAVAMLSPKRAGRHPAFGTIYYWSLTAVFGSAAGLTLVRWVEDYHLAILGAMSLCSATLGRTAMRHHWPHWVRLHISGMGLSYILLLTAFYVDNGKSLPVWKDLPSPVYWTLPAAAGLPIVLWALFRHSLVRKMGAHVVRRA